MLIEGEPDCPLVHMQSSVALQWNDVNDLIHM